MPVPTPKHPLEDVCSAIFDNTLYTYSKNAFQALELTEGATWKVLPMGVAVEGSACVKSTPKNDTAAAAFWVVGGKANSSMNDYEGLQRYTFAKGEWETIRPTVPVTQQRQWHGATYLNTSDSILLFAGTQDGSRYPSSQTFTIKASDPYDVVAYEANVPPAISPLVIPFTESKAVYLGGSESNTKVMIFSPSNSWEDSNATLASPFYNTSRILGTLQNGNDGSKSLYTFDMTVTPNSVNRTVLMNADGNPVSNAAPIVSSRDIFPTQVDDRSLERRRNLTVANWPPYNDTLAPSSTRTKYTVARDQSGMTVIAGGNPNDVLSIFKAQENCWVNATEKLTSKSVRIEGLGPSPSTTSSFTAGTASTSGPASASSTTIAGATGPTSSPFPTKILGAVLGSLAGAALILLALLFLLRWKRKRRQYTDAGHQRRSSGVPDEKMDFADGGLLQISSARQFRGHEQQESAGSFSSMAILMGRVGHKRGGDKSNGSLGSDSSSQFNKDYKAAIGKPRPIQGEQAFRTLAEPVRDEKPLIADERGAVPRTRGSNRGGRRGSTRRSSGWNRYWSGGSAMSILGFGKRNTVESDRSSDSHYSEHRVPSQVTQASALVPPLKIGARPEMHRVVSGSPTIRGGGNFPLTREMSGQIERHGSVSTLSSYDDRRDAFSSGIPASVHDEQTFWTPFEREEWAKTRAPSNIYSESNYATTVGRETLFPRPPTSQQPPPPQTSQHTSDMSWLNLGGEQRRL